MEELAVGLVFAVVVLDGQDLIAQHVSFRIIALLYVNKYVVVSKN